MAPLSQPPVAINRASVEQSTDKTRINHDGGARLAQGPVAPPVATTLHPSYPLYQPCVLDAHGRLCPKPRWNTRIGILDGNRL